MADSQYFFVSSCQHDFNAVVYASYLAYSCVPLCEADPGQVSCCAFVTSPPPPCGWLPCHSLWRWGMVATALNITWGGARTRQGVPSALTGGKPVLQPHWPRSEKVNNYKMVDIVPCRETVLWAHQTVWCSSTFHILLEQSQPPGLPSPPSNISGGLIRIWLPQCCTSEQLLVGRCLFLCIPSLKRHC